jgi:monoterpene epsilon-lactone hydrolase
VRIDGAQARVWRAAVADWLPLSVMASAFRSLGLLWLAFFQTLWARLRRGPLRPSWSFLFQMLVRYVRIQWDRTADWDLKRVREDVNARPYPKKHVRLVDIHDEELGGVPTRVFAPRESRGGAVILFFHGGSFVYGSTHTTHAELVAALANATGLVVYGLEYRLAPEHPYPAQLEDALRAFDALVADGVEPNRILLAGDSAGANLALVTQIALRDRASPRARALVLLSPWCDLTMPGASYRENEPFDIGTRNELCIHAKAFVGDVSLDDPRVSPIHANLRDVGPVFVSVGGCESPKDDILRLVDALREAEADTRVHEATDMPHNPTLFADFHPSGHAAFEATLQFVREIVRV